MSDAAKLTAQFAADNDQAHYKHPLIIGGLFATEWGSNIAQHPHETTGGTAFDGAAMSPRRGAVQC